MWRKTALEFWGFCKRNIVPDLLVKRRFNFITIHYLYLMGMALLLSVIMYVQGGMAYIDALFFASGACTQSGLNTVDVDLITTGQQAMLFLGGMLCNPIFINSVVVFVRLYWFEKRFKDVVQASMTLRRTKSRSRNNTMARDDPEVGAEARGVNGQAIKILRHTGHSDGQHSTEKVEIEPQPNEKAMDDSSNTSQRESDDMKDPDVDNPLHLKSTRSTEDMRVPSQLSPEQHIRFLERQRNPADTSALRIPSPREFDLGGRPENIRDSIDERLERSATTDPNLESSNQKASMDLNSGPDGAAAGHIAFDEPRHIRERGDRATTFPRLGTRQSTVPRDAYDSSGQGGNPRMRRSSTFRTLQRSNTGRTLEQAPYLSWEPTIGRNSVFIGLTEEQREELGGIEYRALKTLALILVAYFFAFHLLGMICLIPWILHTSYGQVVTAQGQGRVWWGIFTAASAFNDLGFTLTNNSMISFGSAVFPLLLMTFLIIIGNTGFPCMLRFVIWAIAKLTPYGGAVWEELQFLLDHPRRCFTLLFPREATWWLFFILVILNGLDLVFFIILDLNDSTIMQIPGGLRFLDGLFQAASTRTAGFSVVNLADLHPAIQVSYLIMMYISVFPIAISMRRTNVYEEKSLGIYNSPGEEDEDEKEPSYVGAHLRKQLSFDLWYIFLGLFIIAIVEGGQLQNTNQYAFTLFSVLFEIVSAYGTVGLSLGYPTINASFSAEFHTLSKLIIISMQIRGRHRGLPYELDRAILLPSESLQAKEAKEAERVLRRRRSSLGGMSTTSAVNGNMEGSQFRPETGLGSGFQAGSDGSSPRPRGNTNISNTSSEHKDAHVPSARHGLGNVMFSLANNVSSIKE
ncbi:cation transport protein-domain-containing protein [Exophiala viscosa]|uniref:cation transport protein-domain-containing protein n=1 Tax=Exophiala viscosa TaxID=2486360 RepID=UPI0021952F45|nr:cation transport protein-domain-containing protein [Exophiala viscosa]